MTKENLEIYQVLYTKSQLKRMKVVDEYLNNFGEIIKKKAISPNSAFEALARKYVHKERLTDAMALAM